MKASIEFYFLGIRFAVLIPCNAVVYVTFSGLKLLYNY